MASGTGKTVVFDIGGVLIDWNPRYLFRRRFDGDEQAMEDFLADVCTSAWNQTFDAGRSFADGTAELIARHPRQREHIEAYDRNWEDMVAGPIDATVAHLRALADAGTDLCGLSNWSAEKFPPMRTRFDFLALLDPIVLSGEIGLIKPDAAIFHHLTNRIGKEPAACVFIDDSRPNIDAAADLGFDVIHFRSPEQLGGELAERGLAHNAAAT